jgi:hypothetical protein
VSFKQRSSFNKPHSDDNVLGAEGTVHCAERNGKESLAENRYKSRNSWLCPTWGHYNIMAFASKTRTKNYNLLAKI